MRLLFKSTTVSGVLGAAYGTTVDGDSLDGDALIAGAVSTSILTGTAAGQHIANQKHLKDIRDRYATAAVDSLTDDQLAAACEKLDLIYAEKYENVNDNVHKL